MACSTWLKTVMVSCGYVVTLCPCSRSGMPVHLQTGKHLPETWEGIIHTHTHSLSTLLRPGSIWRAGLSSVTDTHNSPWPPPPCVLESSNIFILSDVHLFPILLLFFFLHCLRFSLIFLVHQQMHPRFKNIAGTRSCFSSCFCSHSFAFNSRP